MDLKKTILLFMLAYGCLAAEEDVDPGVVGLFAFAPSTGEVKDNGRLVIALTLSPFTGLLEPASTQINKRMYSIFISARSDLATTRRVDVIFGGNKQYAFKIAGLDAPTIVPFGEVIKTDDYSIFAGFRRNPAYGDIDALNEFLSAPCAPIEGLLCSGKREPENAMAEENVVAIVFDATKSWLYNEEPETTPLKVWAKEFEEE